MRNIINMKHHFDDYECMWNGIEDIYINKIKESLPENFFFVLSGFGSFCYLKTNKSDLKRMVALGDGRTKKMYEFLAPIVGFEYKHHQYSSFESAIKKAKSEVDKGYPVVLGALDMYYLPYFEKLYHREHIPFHYVLMVGYDDEKECIYLHDCGREDIISISYQELSKAMDCNYPGLSKENTVCTIRMNNPKDKIQIAKESLKIKKELFLNPPRSFLGYKGFEKFIKELPKWKDEIEKVEYDKIFTNMVTFFGTVPILPNKLKGICEPDEVEFKGGFDKMSKILKYLAEETKEDYWIKSARYFEEGAIVISKISEIIINYLASIEDKTELLSKLFSEVLDKMIKGYQVLDI